MGKLDALLAEIKNQRWYFFENNEKILFDRDTGLTWTNLKFFPYQANGANPYTCTEAKDLVIKINSQSWGGCNNWKIPTPQELWQFVEDKTFPFRQKNHWRINNEFGWCVNANGVLSRKDLDYPNAYSAITADGFANVILCSDALKPANFEPNTILNNFQKYNLVPKFNSAVAAKLFKESQLENFKFDFAKYDAAAINSSPIKYHQAVSSVTAEMLEFLQELADAQQETIEEAAQLTRQIRAKTFDNPQLSPEENKFLVERQENLAKLLTFGADDATAQILLVRAQAEKLAARIDETNHNKNSLINLAEIENSPRPSFEFLTENLAQIVSNAQNKINFFDENKNSLAQIVKIFAAWNDDYISFKSKLRPQFENLCHKNKIPPDIFGEWQKLRLAVEEKFLPLIEFGLKENCLDAALEILDVLQWYKSTLDNFYSDEENIRRRFDVEENPRSFTPKFQRTLEKIISKRQKAVERIALKKIASFEELPQNFNAPYQNNSAQF